MLKESCKQTCKHAHKHTCTRKKGDVCAATAYVCVCMRTERESASEREREREREKHKHTCSLSLFLSLPLPLPIPLPLPPLSLSGAGQARPMRSDSFWPVLMQGWCKELVMSCTEAICHIIMIMHICHIIRGVGHVLQRIFSKVSVLVNLLQKGI